jgi:hypothetical protein
MPKRFLKMGAGDESCDSESISSFNCSEVGRTRRDGCTAAQRGVEVMGRVMEEEAMGSEGSCACALPELTGSVMTRGPRIQRSYGCSSTYVIVTTCPISATSNHKSKYHASATSF